MTAFSTQCPQVLKESEELEKERGHLGGVGAGGPAQTLLGRLTVSGELRFTKPVLKATKELSFIPGGKKTAKGTRNWCAVPTPSRKKAGEMGGLEGRQVWRAGALNAVCAQSVRVGMSRGWT